MSHIVRRLVLVATCFTVSASAEALASQCQGVQYQGGAVIENVKIVTVYWGMAAATDRKNIDDAYLKMVQGPFFDWLREYDAGGQKIRRGTFGGSVIDPAPPSKTVVDDQRDLVPHLAALIDAKTVPAPDDNTLYMVHFPSSIVITMYGSSSCQEFCAYHSSFTHKGQVVRYAAMPDQNGGGCQNGCGVSSSKPVDSTSLTASHEVIEAVTDPDPGAGWYDTLDSNSTYCGEVGDICNAIPGSANTAVIQKSWSNKQHACVDHDATVKVIDFSLALSQASVSAWLGQTTTVTVTSTPAANALAGNATLVVDGLPMGVTVAAAPAAIATNASSVLTFTVAATAATGSYPYTVTGTSAGDNVIHSVTGTIVVSDMPPPPPPDMSQPGPGVGSGGGSAGSGDGDNGMGGVGSGGGGAPGDGTTPSSGCSMSGDASAGLLLGVLAILLIFGLTRRRT
jgi:MYXO-CTERM domain-containing protein